MPNYPTWRQGLDGPELEGGVTCTSRKLQDCESAKGCYIRKAYQRNDGEPVRASCVKGKHSEGKDERKGKPLRVNDLITLPDLAAIVKVQMRYPNLRISAAKLQHLKKFAEVEPVPYKFVRSANCPAAYPREVDPECADENDLSAQVLAQKKLVVNRIGNVCLEK